jgi:hypothetical protein
MSEEKVETPVKRKCGRPRNDKAYMDNTIPFSSRVSKTTKIKFMEVYRREQKKIKDRGEKLNLFVNGIVEGFLKQYIQDHEDD